MHIKLYTYYLSALQVSWQSYLLVTILLTCVWGLLSAVVGLTCYHDARSAEFARLYNRQIIKISQYFSVIYTYMLKTNMYDNTLLHCQFIWSLRTKPAKLPNLKTANNSNYSDLQVS